MARKDFDRHRITKLRAAGWSWRKIGRELGVAHGTVQRAFPGCVIVEAFIAEVYTPGKIDMQHTPLYELRSCERGKP
jgi:lambda repressor-like predicted transcriptional regulator